MISLSYSTFGLTRLPFLEAIDAVAAAGYDGIEISFHRDQFNPFQLTDAELDAVRQRLDATGLVPACVATASHFFTPSRPHEPSLLALERAGRKRRIDLIRRGIDVARRLGSPLVSFGSGFVREEHARNPQIDPQALLVDSICECLDEVGEDEDITLLIEPEPGMYIETLDQGLELVQAVGSPKFALHIDLCHAWCSDVDTLDALARAAPHARYLHVSDAVPGWNIKIVEDHRELAFDLDRASTLVHFADSADYLLVDRAHPLYFCDQPPSQLRRLRIHSLLRQAGITAEPELVAMANLPTADSVLDDEIFTYLISVPNLSFDVLERAHPILAWLRGADGPARIDKMVANTRTGIVHFHEIPGAGTLDLAASFRTLDAHGFDGFATVELYHHITSWQQALADSHRHLSAALPSFV